jgi:alkylhydroperoxidase/carboxymuconolactone decarboxylase family protein YurZ
MVINPEYKRIGKKLKNGRRDRSILLHKMREAKEKIGLSEEAQARFMIKHRDDFEKLELLEQRIDELIEQRKATAQRIKVKEMTEEERYSKLETETKTLINLVNMICYRAETAMAQNVLPFLAQGDDEKRVLIRNIMNTSADVTPDTDKKTLTVTLHSLSAPRYNAAVESLTKLLTETETVFPGTDLRMIFKTSAFSLC